MAALGNIAIFVLLIFGVVELYPYIASLDPSPPNWFWAGLAFLVGAAIAMVIDETERENKNGR